MACKGCHSHGRTLLRAAVRATATRTTPLRSLAVLAPPQPRIHSRSLSSTPSARGILSKGVLEPYRVIAATERLYKVCAAPANYHITPEERKGDMVRRLEDGEEVGSAEFKRNPWHFDFGLLPTFSTWSHVTMIHLYVLNARLRCFDGAACRSWQQQMIDHFFFDCEKKMHVDHNITSSALRQRYLKDIFVQWRGVILAYDEGLIKGDAILASAVWRNLFKGQADADPRALAAIVTWIRSGLAALEDAPDEILDQRAMEVLSRPVDALWKKIEAPLRKGGEEKRAEMQAGQVTREKLAQQAS